MAGPFLPDCVQQQQQQQKQQQQQQQSAADDQNSSPCECASIPGSSCSANLAAVLIAAGFSVRASDSFFSSVGGKHAIDSFQSENAFYYSFYKQVAESTSWAQALQLLREDSLSEAPFCINALRRFNIYQELVFGLAYRCLYFLGLDAAAFYCYCVFLVYGAGLLALLSMAGASGDRRGAFDERLVQ
ncbi:unnamed protein product, partial [Polarella glacialis]